MKFYWLKNKIIVIKKLPSGIVQAYFYKGNINKRMKSAGYFVTENEAVTKLNLLSAHQS